MERNVESGMKMAVDYDQLGRQIKKRRRALGQTQDALAEVLGVSVGYVSQIERGVTKVSLDTLASIAACLGCDPSELLAGAAPGAPGYLDGALSAACAEMSPSQKKLLLSIAEDILETQ